MEDREAARGLGVASIGIGVTELAAPRRIERLLGIGDGEITGMLRVLGVREILHGVDILAHRDPAPGMWSRMAGDVLDVSLLGIAGKKSRRRGGLVAVLALVLGIGLLDAVLGWRLAKKRGHC
jgi:hypothetical protein